MIIDVQCEDSVILARIVQEAENAYNVNFLEKSVPVFSNLVTLLKL